MEYIISGSQVPTGDIYEDETYCSRGLCQHPSCWDSHIRQSRGFRKYVSLSADNATLRSHQQIEDNGSDDGLPTMKVLNMLDEYGDSPTDKYPSSHKGLPAHKQYPSKVSKPHRSRYNLKNDQIPRTSLTSSKAKLFKDILEPSRTEAAIKQVEVHIDAETVQEVFDLEELNQSWASTFITRPMYVWIPGKQKRKKKRSKSSIDQQTRSHDTVTMKDVTNDLLPRQPYAQPPVLTDPSTLKRGKTMPVAPPSSAHSHYFKPAVPRSKSPLPTGGQPYRNVGQTPKDRMRFRVIMNELKDLPRPFVLEVLEQARDLDTKEDVLMLMERYLKTMRKSDWELSMVTGKVLQQQRMSSNMFGVTEKLNTINTNQVYKLDEAEVDKTTLASIPADVMQGSIYNSGKYTPLPAIARRKKNSVRVHVSTTTEDSVKPFQYKKQSDMEFCLGPTRSLSTLISRPQSEERSSVSVRDPANPAADLSVLYDQESVDRNRNVNNNVGKMRAEGDSVPNDSRTSSTIPKAPAGTPYTPKTPFKDKNSEKALGTEAVNLSPEGVVLEVIQEMTVVDEFAADNRKLSLDPNLTTKSAIETRSLASPIKRRVVSANIPRVEPELTDGRRARSADFSLAVGETSSVGEIDQVLDMVPQPGRVTTSRLDVASSTSNWPTVDEEALLREQATPKPEPLRVSSAPDSKQKVKDKDKRPVTQPASAKEESLKTTIVVDLPPVTMDESAPAPPPPSPEPQGKTPRTDLKKDIPASQSEGTNANIDLSDLGNALPSTVEEDEGFRTQTDLQPTVNKQIRGTEAVGAADDNSSIPTAQSNVADSKPTQSAATEDEQEFCDRYGISTPQSTQPDPLSFVPNELTQEMDKMREISLSAAPPSNLATPDASPYKTRPIAQQNVEKCDEASSSAVTSGPLATLGAPSAPTTSVMKEEDQGGLSGQ